MFKGCSVFMPILVLLEDVVYLWLSIWGLVLRECRHQIADIAKQPFQYVMDLIYFYDEDCGNRSVLIPTSSAVTLLNCSKSAVPTINRSFIFLFCYLISTMWILTSLWAILTTFCRAHNSVKILSFGTWFTVVLAGSGLDAGATGYHVYNLVHSTLKVNG